nr:hypothetical protein [Candidatus Kapabacteria bacterium]
MIFLLLFGALFIVQACVDEDSPGSDPNNSGIVIKVKNLDMVDDMGCEIPPGTELICSTITYNYSSKWMSGGRQISFPGLDEQVFKIQSADLAGQMITVDVEMECIYADLSGIGQRRICRGSKTAMVYSGVLTVIDELNLFLRIDTIIN